jgi:hypothetical protein
MDVLTNTVIFTKVHAYLLCDLRARRRAPQLLPQNVFLLVDAPRRAARRISLLVVAFFLISSRMFPRIRYPAYVLKLHDLSAFQVFAEASRPSIPT